MLSSSSFVLPISLPLRLDIERSHFFCDCCTCPWPDLTSRQTVVDCRVHGDDPQVCHVYRRVP